MKVMEQVVGNEMRSTSEIKSEFVDSSLQSYQHDSLQCFQCFITFSNWKTKKRHMRMSHPDQYTKQLQQVNTAFRCYKCVKEFATPHELREHQASHSTGEKAFQCLRCRKQFLTYAELIPHKRNECKGRRFCNDCGVLLRTPSQLRNHCITVHSHNPAVANDLNVYKCCKCDSDFQTEEDLLQHQDLNCDVNSKAKKHVSMAKDAVQGMCDSKKIIQEKDAAGHKGYGDTPAGGPSDELKPELKIPCPEADCDLIFPSVAPLWVHKKDQHGPLSRKTHAHRKCNESYTNPSRLRSHRITVHPHNPAVGENLNTYQCCKCDSDFQTEEELLQHQDLNCDVNSKAKKHVSMPKDAVQGMCDSKKIIQEKDAAGHKGYGDTPAGGPSDELKPELKIPCPEADCDLIFPSVAALRVHKKDQHGPLSRKTHAHRKCNESYTNPSRLRSHRITVHPHNPAVGENLNTYQCCKCDWDFQTEEELLQHQDLNCDIKPRTRKRVCMLKDAVRGISDSKKIKQEKDAARHKGYGDTPAGGPSDELKPELKIPCPEADCDLIFPSVAALRAHKKGQHRSLSHWTHVCRECNESYANPKQLKAHLARAHRSAHISPSWGKSFARKKCAKGLPEHLQ